VFASWELRSLETHPLAAHSVVHGLHEAAAEEGCRYHVCCCKRMHPASPLDRRQNRRRPAQEAQRHRVQQGLRLAMAAQPSGQPNQVCCGGCRAAAEGLPVRLHTHLQVAVTLCVDISTIFAVSSTDAGLRGVAYQPQVMQQAQNNGCILSLWHACALNDAATQASAAGRSGNVTAHHAPSFPSLLSTNALTPWSTSLVGCMHPVSITWKCLLDDASCVRCSEILICLRAMSEEASVNLTMLDEFTQLLSKGRVAWVKAPNDQSVGHGALASRPGRRDQVNTSDYSSATLQTSFIPVYVKVAGCCIAGSLLCGKQQLACH
jgi:hypothetical protein